ncbi:MAG: hypothetical protein HRU24_13225 [Gammaproteobacteria bacterium]|nr:hypothetical protein [Gammaproteobacteria bacterium]
MDANLSFQLKDRYSTKIWNPNILDPKAQIRSVNGEYFFSVIYSVHREKRSEHKEVSQLAIRTLTKFTQEIGELEKELISQTELMEHKKTKCVFSVTFPKAKVINVAFTPQKNSGICPENAQFLKVFIEFDKYVSLLGDIRSMALITEKEYYVQRKIIQSKLRGIMAGYYALIKQVHNERRKVVKMTVSNKSLKGKNHEANVSTG